MVDGRGVRASLKAGADPAQRLDGVTVAAAIGLPEAEMELLRKVHHILAGQADQVA